MALCVFNFFLLLPLVTDVVAASVPFDLIVFLRASPSAQPHRVEMQQIISSFLLEHNSREPPGINLKKRGALYSPHEDECL